MRVANLLLELLKLEDIKQCLLFDGKHLVKHQYCWVQIKTQIFKSDLFFL